jgi:hypothetical protein
MIFAMMFLLSSDSHFSLRNTVGEVVLHRSSDVHMAPSLHDAVFSSGASVMPGLHKGVSFAGFTHTNGSQVDPLSRCM